MSLIFLSTLPARGATWRAKKSRLSTAFLSTLPARGATRVMGCPLDLLHISIHAPREGSDHQVLMQGGQTPYFYPRSPRGERPHRPGHSVYADADFYPRSPRGERPHVQMGSIP